MNIAVLVGHSDQREKAKKEKKILTQRLEANHNATGGSQISVKERSSDKAGISPTTSL